MPLVSKRLERCRYYKPRVVVYDRRIVIRLDTLYQSVMAIGLNGANLGSTIIGPWLSSWFFDILPVISSENFSLFFWPLHGKCFPPWWTSSNHGEIKFAESGKNSGTFIVSFPGSEIGQKWFNYFLPQLLRSLLPSFVRFARKINRWSHVTCKTDCHTYSFANWANGRSALCCVIRTTS